MINVYKSRFRCDIKLFKTRVLIRVRLFVDQSMDDREVLGLYDDSDLLTRLAYGAFAHRLADLKMPGGQAIVAVLMPGIGAPGEQYLPIPDKDDIHRRDKFVTLY